MPNLSAVIIAKNEAVHIGKTIASLKFCDEVIVIDDLSTDETVKISQSLGAKVYSRDLVDDFSEQRNYGLMKAKSKWVLFVDADEIITPALQKEIVREVAKAVNYASGYTFKRIDHVWGQKIKHGEIGDVRLLRLARRNAGKWHRLVHEHWHVIGQIKEFKNPIQHYPHPTLSEFIRELNERSTLHAQANKQEGKRSSLGKIIWYPASKFIYGYILRLGFLDGLAGFVIAMTMSMHSFLSWSKLWMLQKN